MLAWVALRASGLLDRDRPDCRLGCSHGRNVARTPGEGSRGAGGAPRGPIRPLKSVEARSAHPATACISTRPSSSRIGACLFTREPPGKREMCVAATLSLCCAQPSTMGPGSSPSRSKAPRRSSKGARHVAVLQALGGRGLPSRFAATWSQTMGRHFPLVRQCQQRVSRGQGRSASPSCGQSSGRARLGRHAPQPSRARQGSADAAFAGFLTPVGLRAA